MNKAEYDGFMKLIILLDENGYKFHTFEFNDIFNEWIVDFEGNPTGIRRFGLRLVKDNKVVSPTVEIDSIQYNMIKELDKSWILNNE